jgi:hypothetical protein
MTDTNTPNIGILLPDPGDVINVVTQIEAGFTLVDTYMGAVKCTSIARPSTTYGGQIIYETDTKRLAENTGTGGAPVWTYVSSTVLVYTSTTRPTLGLVAGLLIHETDTDALVRYTGSAWEYATTVKCTSGTRPTTALAAGVTAYETDTTRQILWSGAAWQQDNLVVCTSSTRPAHPITGGEIFETDTGACAIYNGTNYLYQAQQAAPTLVLGSTTASVTFTGLPPATRMQMYWRARSSTAAAVDVEMQIDGNTGNVYQWAKIESASGAASAMHSGAAVAFGKIGVIDGTTTSYFGSGCQTIDGWSNATGFTTWTGPYANFSTTTADWSGVASGQMAVAAPHTSIKIMPSANSFAAGSQFTPYAVM